MTGMGTRDAQLVTLPNLGASAFSVAEALPSSWCTSVTRAMVRIIAPGCVSVKSVSVLL